MVVTCFFIDTATNILSYIETIHKILKEGGTWINIGMCFILAVIGATTNMITGPLLYHFEDAPNESSIELSLEEVKRVSKDIGFQFTVSGLIVLVDMKDLHMGDRMKR